MTATATRKGHIVVVALILSLLPSLHATVAAAREVVRSGVLAPDLSHSEGMTTVIVRGVPSSTSWARAAVGAVGGTVTADLTLVDGVAAVVPAARLAELADAPGILSVSRNSTVTFTSQPYDPGTAANASNFVRSTGAAPLWRYGKYGKGVGVAVIDTGISPMNDFAGRLVHGPDLSGEGTIIDTYGHGTVMGGLIGGNGADSRGRTGGAYMGIAPESTLVAVKAAGRNGATDVSTMLQAMHWVSAYKDQFNIRVLSLSWGTDSAQDPAVDPINYAVERLWRQGIVVVVSAGNGGPGAGTITKPGDDPLAITVGAYDDNQNTTTSDDSIPEWTSRGPTAQGGTKPDLVAPGRTLVASRSYGSAVEQGNPGALVSPSYIKGSGSSEATAVTAGAAALLLQTRPNLTPDQVKALLKSTASPISGTSANTQGAGRLQIGAATGSQVPSNSTQSFTSSGLGSLEASRGGAHVETDCGQDGTVELIQGEIDVRCEQWDGASWSGASWSGASWSGASWSGASWSGASWSGASWSGASWSGASWSGGTWTGASWSGNAWTGASWSGNAWNGASWSGASWSGASWSGASWSGASWSSAKYDGQVVLATVPETEIIEFGTAFWGPMPQPWESVAGEASASVAYYSADTAYAAEPATADA